MLKQLTTKWVGPAAQLEVNFGSRLNLFTGDNGLGKSFLLDIAWWALTGTWVGNPAHPQKEITPDDHDWPLIEFSLQSLADQALSRKYHYPSQTWGNLDRRRVAGPQSQNLPLGLTLYARIDGGVSIWDPHRNNWKTVAVPAEPINPSAVPHFTLQPDLPEAFHLDPQSLWYGLKKGNDILCNGLLDDWVKWQYKSQSKSNTTTGPFVWLKEIIQKLSPHRDELIEVGEPTRILGGDVREYPTLKLPYGEIPIIHASAGMKRIISLAYAMVWAWYEHQEAAKLTQQTPTTQMVILLDEVEAHLHPRWQRSILPALLEVIHYLNPQMQVQILATTHAPLVLASVESLFEMSQDRLFHFQQNGHDVRLEEIAWSKQGDTVGWLTSEAFGLSQARSREAERAIEAAEAYMRRELAVLPIDLQTSDQIHQELLKVLAGHDPFWPRWIIRRERELDQV
jgi:hypothetical protein